MSFRPTAQKKTISVSGEFVSYNSKREGNLVSRLVTAPLTVLNLGYTRICLLIARKVAFAKPKAITKTPRDYGLSYRDVSFKSYRDHLVLRGWFIPGILPNGQLTAERTLVTVHGLRSNRAALEAGLLDLSAALARRGFAILAFDTRGHGESAPAPLSMGYFEQDDVLGAVDFLRSGSLPYPELDRPYAIGALGISMGGAAALLAAAREPAIGGVVADCAFAALVPLIERTSKIQSVFLPGVAKTVRPLYGRDYHAVRPVDVVASIAPRPLFFIQSGVDSIVPPWNMKLLADAASAAPESHVQTWLVPRAQHIQSYRVMGAEYVNRAASFFTSALGPAPLVTG